MSNLTKEHDFFHLRDKFIRKHWCHTFKKKKVFAPCYSTRFRRLSADRNHAVPRRKFQKRWPGWNLSGWKSLQSNQNHSESWLHGECSRTGWGGGGNSRPASATAHPGSHERSQQDIQRKSDLSAEGGADGTAIRWEKNRIQGRVAKRKPSHPKAFRKMFYEGKSKKTEFRPDDSLVQGWDI